MRPRDAWTALAALALVAGAPACARQAPTFYRYLFGWEAASFDPDYRLVNLEAGIGGGLMRCRDGIPAYVTIYVAVDDLDASLAKATELGGTPLLAPTPIPGVGAFALFQDPEGNTIGILHPEMAA
jgi:predicted enzyme related to lactoylglutathione lyase